jgi:hypothetical protein
MCSLLCHNNHSKYKKLMQMIKKTMELDLELKVLPDFPIVGMIAREIERKFGIKFVYAHPDYSKMIDKTGTLDKRKFRTSKNYAIRASDYVRVVGDYENVADFGVKISSGVKTCAV